MGRIVPIQSAVYHVQESELQEALSLLGKKVGIKNKTEREKLFNGVKYFQHRATDREAGDSLYIRSHLKDGIQKAIFMEADCITEDQVIRNNLVTSTTAIMSIHYGASEGYYDIELFMPI